MCCVRAIPQHDARDRDYAKDRHGVLILVDLSLFFAFVAAFPLPSRSFAGQNEQVVVGERLCSSSEDVAQKEATESDFDSRKLHNCSEDQDTLL